MADGSALGSDQAEFSSVGSELSQKTGDMGVRMDKVASIQAALAAGTYKVLSRGRGLQGCGFDAGQLSLPAKAK